MVGFTARIDVAFRRNLTHLDRCLRVGRSDGRLLRDQAKLAYMTNLVVPSKYRWAKSVELFIGGKQSFACSCSKHKLEGTFSCKKEPLSINVRELVVNLSHLT